MNLHAQEEMLWTPCAYILIESVTNFPTESLVANYCTSMRGRVWLWIVHQGGFFSPQPGDCGQDGKSTTWVEHCMSTRDGHSHYLMWQSMPKHAHAYVAMLHNSLLTLWPHFHFMTSNISPFCCIQGQNLLQPQEYRSACSYPLPLWLVFMLFCVPKIYECRKKYSVFVQRRMNRSYDIFTTIVSSPATIFLVSLVLILC